MNFHDGSSPDPTKATLPAKPAPGGEESPKPKTPSEIRWETLTGLGTKLLIFSVIIGMNYIKERDTIKDTWKFVSGWITTLMIPTIPVFSSEPSEWMGLDWRWLANGCLVLREVGKAFQLGSLACGLMGKSCTPPQPEDGHECKDGQCNHDHHSTELGVSEDHVSTSRLRGA